ncbi:MAG: hypothetical protein EBZ13_05975 [Planctomycetia bacterium]|nr:hypothetical protein [Planctomycetia bacterium]
MPTTFSHPEPNRRSFLAAGSAASLAAGTMVHSSVAASAESRDLRLAVIGCGGRGSGAINNSLSINDGVKLVAAADLKMDACTRMVAAMKKAFPDKVAVEEGSLYSGLDAYERVLADPSVDLVLLTTSPGFRPLMLKAAVEAGKHVFAEKPVCVDARSADYQKLQAVDHATPSTDLRPGASHFFSTSKTTRHPCQTGLPWAAFSADS